MDRYCIIETASNLVVNIIIWDGSSEYVPPDGTFLNPATDDVEIGWVYDPQSGDYSPAQE